MSAVVVRRFEMSGASDSHLDSYHRVMVASAEDWSGAMATDYEGVVGRLRTPLPGMGTTTRFAAYWKDEIVGFATLGFPGHENDALAVLELTVHPARRREGIGRQLMSAVLSEIRSNDRQALEAWGVLKGGPGQEFGRALGFAVVHTTVLQVLDLNGVHADRRDVAVPSGFGIVRWSGSVPDALLSEFACARNAISDAPLGEVAYQNPVWTGDRIREFEARCRADGRELRAVAAVDDVTGQVAGFTLIDLRPHRPDVAYQGDTAVRAEYRGRGLGRVVKSAMSAWLREDRPEVDRVYTTTAETNRHMIDVNHQVGYTTISTTCVLAGNTGDMEARLRNGR